MQAYHKWAIILILLLSSVKGIAQLTVQLDVNPEISPFLYEWEGASAEDILVITDNPTPDVYQVVYRVWMIDGSGEEIANSFPDETPIVNVEPGSSIVTLSEIFPITSLNYSGEFEQEIAQTGQLPEDNYTLCIEVLQAETFQNLSQPSCSSFNIMGYQDPFNIFPPDGQEILFEEVPDVLFQWSPASPAPAFIESYIIQIVEVYAGQTPVEAINVNPSIINETTVGETQFIFPVDYFPIQENGSGYAWTVVAVNDNNENFTQPNGQSEPTTFIVSQEVVEVDCPNLGLNFGDACNDGNIETINDVVIQECTCVGESITVDICECVSCSIAGMTMLVNGLESTSEQIPAGIPISFTPQYEIECNNTDCPISFQGQLTASYSSQQHPNQTFAVEAGQEIILPGYGLLYLSWTGTAYCDQSECVCEGTYGPVQWQVAGIGSDISDVPGDNEDSGTEVPDGTTSSEDCACGPCSLSTITFKQNGNPVGSNIPLGVPLTIDAPIDASCIGSPCPLSINGYFKIGYTPEGGSYEDVILDNNEDEFVLPQNISMIIVDFIGTVTCDGITCSCDGVNGLEIFVNTPPPHAGDPKPVPDPENPGEPPGETVPPDSLKMRCNAVLVDKDAASPIDLGMVLDEPTKFPYPRAVPLRAEGIDWDYAIFECDGCNAGASQIKYPVKDRMNLGAYKWEIRSGLGSLNSPYVADSITAAEDQKKALLEMLNSLGKEKDELQDRLDNGLAQDSSRFAQLLKEELEGKEKLEERILEITDSLNQVIQVRDELDARFENYKDSLSANQDSIPVVRQRIIELEEKLKNPSSAEEVTALGLAETAAEEWETARKAVTDFEEEIIQAVEDIATNLENLKQTEKDKAQLYINKSNSLFSLARHISTLESSVYNSAELRKYRRTRTVWNREYNKFYNPYVAGQSFASSWDAKKLEVNNKTRELASTIPSERGVLYNDVHNELLGFATLPPVACNSSVSASTCLTFAGDLLDATLKFDSAMAELNASNSFLDLSILMEINQARDSLSMIESALDGYRIEAEQASIAYQLAADNVVDQLALLESQKQEKIEAMKQKEIASGQAEAVYQEAKRVRESLFAENKLEWENNLLDESGNMDYIFIRIDIATDSLNNISMDLWEYDQVITSINFDKDALEEELKFREDQLSKLKAKIETLKKEPIEINKRIEEIEKKIEETLDKLKEVEEHLANLNSPNRTAAGPLVYYIPPPLEEIFKINNKLQEFEEKIALVDSMRTNLEIAINEKRALQKKLVMTIDNIAWDLLSYKNSKSSIDALTENINNYNHELAQAQGEIASEHLEDQESLQDKWDEIKRKESEAKENHEDCEEGGDEIKEKIKAFDAEKKIKEAEVDQKKVELSDAKAQLKYNEDLFRASSATVIERSKNVEVKKNEVVALEQGLGRLQNEKTLDMATNEEGLGNDAAGTEELKSQIETEKLALEGLEASLASIQSSQKANSIAVTQASKIIFTKDSLLNIARIELTVVEDSLFKYYEKLKRSGNCSDSWKKVEAELKREAQKIRKVINDKKDEIGGEIDGNEDVQAIEDRIAEAESSLEEMEQNIAKKQTSVTKAVQDKTNWINKVEADIVTARLAKEEAELALRDWLVAEFESVKFEVKLELKGDDEVVLWRSGDGEAKMLRDLKYENSRIPSFNNKYAQGGLPDLDIPSVCQIALEKKIGGAPDKLIPPTPKGPEPRTIALVYEDGKPLWPEWPVIPQDEKRFLQKDALFLSTYFIDDIDLLIYSCASQLDCPGIPPISNGIVDVRSYNWELEGEHINAPKNWRYAIWEPAIVPKPEKFKLQKLKSFFLGDLIVGDNKVEQEAKYKVHPGVMIEVPDTLFGVPDTLVELTARVVQGDHDGLVGEQIEFSARILSGESNGYGFGDAQASQGAKLDSIKTVPTKDLGYANIDFNFGDGFAKFEVTVKWLRGGAVLAEERTILIAPISIDIHKVGPGPPEIAWVMAAGILQGGNADLNTLTSSLPSCVYDGETQNTEDCNRAMRCVSGLLNYYHDFINEKIVEFEVKDDRISLDPVSDSTEYFGIAHTLLDVPEKVEAEITASIEEKYFPLGRPATVNSKVSTLLIEEFYIGTDELPFLVKLDNPVPVGTIINGQGMLGVDENGSSIGLMMPLLQVKLNVEGVELEKKGDKQIAISGKVFWEGEGIVKANVLSFEMEASKLGITASMGAEIEGKVSHEKALKDPVKFNGLFEPSGDFVVGISDLPELEFMEMKLVKGAAIILDMHASDGPTSSPGFKGIFIPTASMQLPSSFNNGTTKEPTLLSVSDFFIGESGISGELNMDGSFFEVGYQEYVLQAKSLSVVLENNELTAFGMAAKIELGSPFQGDLLTEFNYSGEKYNVQIQTEHPVTIPQIKMVISILPNSGFFAENDIYALKLNANIQSKHLGTMKVDGLKISSNGDLELKEFSIKEDIKFGSGFRIQKPSLSFKVTDQASDVTLGGKIILPKLEDTYLDGSVTLSSGPVLSVEVNDVAITIEHGPVSMTGKLAFSSSEFRGEFDVGFKNLPGDISGLLIFGNKPIEGSDSHFSYWYGELSVPLAIPIGQTGISILKLGGGLGYNFTPPMGDVEGFAVNSESFSFKALMGFGNTPRGKVFAGDVQMSFTSSAFSLYGRMWALDKRESFFGEGQISLIYDPVPAKIEGYLGMGIKLPDTDGALVNFDGRVDFKYSPSEFIIRSKKLDGAVFKEIKANGKIDIDNTKLYLSGKLWYDLNKSFEITSQERLEIVLNVTAQGSLDYQYEPQTLQAEVGFDGNWRVTFVNRIKDLNVIAGSIDLDASVNASPSSMSFAASAVVSWDFFLASGSMDADFGYTVDL